MRAILVMAAKDLKIIWRDRMGLFFIIGFPIIMGVFFGLIGSSMAGGGGGTARMQVAIIDRDRSERSQAFIKSLIDTGDVERAALPDTATTDDQRVATASDLVRKGQLLAFVALPSGFGETAGIMWVDPPVIEIGIDPSRGPEAAMLEGMLMQAMGNLVSQRFMDPKSMTPAIDQVKESIAKDTQMSLARRLALTALMGSLDGLMNSLEDVNQADDESGQDASAAGPKMQLVDVNRIDVTRKADEHELTAGLRSAWDISFPSAILWGMLGSSAVFAVSIVRERKQGTFLRLQVAPISTAHILGGKAAACFMAAVLVNIVMLALGYGLGLRPRDWPLLVLAIGCVSACFVGVMMLMSVIGDSEEAVSGAAWGANVLMAMFGGGMIPLVFMPAFMKPIASFSPVKWGVLALEGAIWRGFSLSDMVFPCAVLLCVGIGAFCIGWFILLRKSA